jgi:hypothetical protein
VARDIALYTSLYFNDKAVLVKKQCQRDHWHLIVFVSTGFRARLSARWELACTICHQSLFCFTFFQKARSPFLHLHGCYFATYSRSILVLENQFNQFDEAAGFPILRLGKQEDLVPAADWERWSNNHGSSVSGARYWCASRNQLDVPDFLTASRNWRMFTLRVVVNRKKTVWVVLESMRKAHAIIACETKLRAASARRWSSCAVRQ